MCQFCVKPRDRVEDKTVRYLSSWRYNLVGKAVINKLPLK